MSYKHTQGCLEPAVLRKLLSKTRPGTPLPLPRPPKKKHPQPTRKRLLIKSPSPVRCPRNRFPGPSPSVNPCIGPHAKDSHPKTRKRLRADSVKNTHLKPSCHRTRNNNRTTHAAACPRNGPGLPPTGPSPGADPPIYPSSLPLASGNPLSNIFPFGVAMNTRST